MIDLKLAEYNSEGKFVGFLELYDFFVIEEGAKFILGNNSIRIVENDFLVIFVATRKMKKTH